MNRSHLSLNSTSNGDESRRRPIRKTEEGSSNSKERSLDSIDSVPVVVSIAEARGRDIGLCCIDTSNRSSLEIHLILDSHSYMETILVLEEINPDEILLSESVKSSVLAKKVLSFAGTNSCKVVFINRQYFDQDLGAEVMRRVAVGCIDADLISKYTVLAGSYCLIKYIENSSGSMFGNHSLRAYYVNKAGSRMSIDRRTATNLELVANLRSRSSKDTLFGAVNHTVTAVGARLLRSNILRPQSDLATIECRLNLVDLLVQQPSSIDGLKNILRQFPELDKMLNGIASISKAITFRSVRRAIDDSIALKQVLRCCRLLNQELRRLSSYDFSSLCYDDINYSTNSNNSDNDNYNDGNCFGNSNINSNSSSGRGRGRASGGDGGTGSGNHDNGGEDAGIGDVNRIVLSSIAVFSSKDLVILSEEVDKYLSESTVYSKSSFEMQHQECFAINRGSNGNLDVARKTYLQTMEDLYERARGYEEEYSVQVKVVYTASRGFHLLLPSTLNPLPMDFKQAVSNKKGISCTTDIIQSLSDRCQEMLASALQITYEILRALNDMIRSNMEILFAVVDSVAILDMLASFATVVGYNKHIFTRPVLTNSPSNEDVLVIQAGRHPIICSSSTKTQASDFIANDCFIGPFENVQIITGPNGSGKTIFIKQVALIIILAQIGCYVPCFHATIPIRDRILSRIGTSDDMENNMSTFATEMNEAAYILSNVSDRSLVIIDELGRGTSNIDGMSIAVSVLEFLSESSCFTLFVTHYPQVTRLAAMYVNIKNIHLSTTIKVVGCGNLNNNFKNTNSSGRYSSSSFSSSDRNMDIANGSGTASISAFRDTSFISNSNSNNAKNIFTPSNKMSGFGSSPRSVGAGAGAGGGEGGGVDDSENYRCSIQYHHKLSNGPCDMSTGYGLIMADVCGMPHDVVAEARQIHRLLRDSETLIFEDGSGQLINEETDAVTASNRLLNDMTHSSSNKHLLPPSTSSSSSSSFSSNVPQDRVHIDMVLMSLLQDIQILRSSKLSDSDLVEYLASLQVQYCNNDAEVTSQLQEHLLEHLQDHSNGMDTEKNKKDKGKDKMEVDAGNRSSRSNHTPLPLPPTFSNKITGTTDTETNNGRGKLGNNNSNSSNNSSRESRHHGSRSNNSNSYNGNHNIKGSSGDLSAKRRLEADISGRELGPDRGVSGEGRGKDKDFFDLSTPAYKKFVTPPVTSNTSHSRALLPATTTTTAAAAASAQFSDGNCSYAPSVASTTTCNTPGFASAASSDIELININANSPHALISSTTSTIVDIRMDSSSSSSTTSYNNSSTSYSSATSSAFDIEEINPLELDILSSENNHNSSSSSNSKNNKNSGFSFSAGNISSQINNSNNNREPMAATEIEEEEEEKKKEESSVALIAKFKSLHESNLILKQKMIGSTCKSKDDRVEEESDDEEDRENMPSVGNMINTTIKGATYYSSKNNDSVNKMNNSSGISSRSNSSSIILKDSRHNDDSSSIHSTGDPGNIGNIGNIGDIGDISIGTGGDRGDNDRGGGGGGDGGSRRSLD